ncbi:MAG: HU family DNA-binding protein [Zoogloeaceae bacterium]|jgi:DNA-binding protein HU-beta|nr:HU family DNA-binding protein [Zoogloeaceae bacterium]
MNKTELVKALAEKGGISLVAAGDALDNFLEIVTNTLASGDSITLVGFGAFSVAERAARKGRNPQTGKEINIAASKAVKFSAGAKLKAAVNPVKTPAKKSTSKKK